MGVGSVGASRSILVATAVAVALVGIPAAAAEPFAPAARIAAGASPAAIAAADFNGDGNADLATADQATNSVAVLLGGGDGTFAAPRSFPTGPGPSDIAAADFNGDRRVDLATANYAGGGSGSVSVLLGSGDGSFDRPRTFDTARGTFGLAAGDLNGDGTTDVATANTLSMSASVLFGYGNGSLAPATHLWTGASSWPWAVAIVDADGAGTADLAVANYEASTVGIMRGFGGSFSSVTQYPTGSHPVGITGADFNGDGRVDLATADLHGDTISVLLGAGGGAFPSSTHYPVGTRPSADVEYPSAIVAADLDSDGDPDLAAPDYETARVSFLLGNDDGTFEAAQHAATQPTPADVVAADFDSDGFTDLATANYSDDSVSVLLNAAAPAPPVPAPAPPPPPAVSPPPPAPPPPPPIGTRTRPAVSPRLEFAHRRPRAGHHFAGARLVSATPDLRLSCVGRLAGARLRAKVLVRAADEKVCVWRLPRRAHGALLRVTVVARGNGVVLSARRAWRVR